MRYLFLILLSVFSFSLYAQEGPKIVFKTMVLDYGEVVVGQDSGFGTFEFKNTGNQPLVIKKVYATCDCMIPKKPSGPIAPGQKGVIEVKYDVSKKREGPIRKTITVSSNAINVHNGMISLRIKGRVVVSN
jgi:hypothetical protein